ncbi:unnamed protein product [Boreogadus saida]
MHLSRMQFYSAASPESPPPLGRADRLQHHEQLRGNTAERQEESTASKHPPSADSRACLMKEYIVSSIEERDSNGFSESQEDAEVWVDVFVALSLPGNRASKEQVSQRATSDTNDLASRSHNLQTASDIEADLPL